MCLISVHFGVSWRILWFLWLCGVGVGLVFWKTGFALRLGKGGLIAGETGILALRLTVEMQVYTRTRVIQGIAQLAVTCHSLLVGRATAVK